MASGAICPRAGGDSHTFNNQYDRSEWMWALRQELDLEPPVVSTGTHFRGVGVGVARPLWAGRQLLWHLPQGHPLTHMGTQHFSPLGSVSSVRWIGRWKSPGLASRGFASCQESPQRPQGDQVFLGQELTCFLGPGTCSAKTGTVSGIPGWLVTLLPLTSHLCLGTRPVCLVAWLGFSIRPRTLLPSLPGGVVERPWVSRAPPLTGRFMSPV